MHCEFIDWTIGKFHTSAMAALLEFLKFFDYTNSIPTNGLNTSNKFMFYYDYEDA